MSNGGEIAIGADHAPRPRRQRPAPTGVIRHYEPRDREAVREISRVTAYRNRGSQAAFTDGEIFADYWTRYYTDVEPESAFVIEENGEVVGYLLGCVDTRRHIKFMGARIVPQLFARLVGRVLTLRDRTPQTRKLLKWALVHSWREAPPVPFDRFPAHYHCNILRKAAGRGYYTMLALRFLDLLDEKGVPALHGQIEDEDGANRARRMQRDADQPDFFEYDVMRPSSFPRIVLGDDRPMHNRAVGARVDMYRRWLLWIAEKYRL